MNIKDICEQILSSERLLPVPRAIRRSMNHSLIASFLKEKKSFPLVQLWFLQDIIEAVHPYSFSPSYNNLDLKENRLNGVVCICDEQPKIKIPYLKSFPSYGENGINEAWFIQLAHCPN